MRRQGGNAKQTGRINQTVRTNVTRLNDQDRGTLDVPNSLPESDPCSDLCNVGETNFQNSRAFPSIFDQLLARVALGVKYVTQ